MSFVLHKTPGKFAVQFVTDAPGRLDFNIRTADSLDDAFGYAREVVATHPDFQWNAVLIWKDVTAEDIKALTEEMQ